MIDHDAVQASLSARLDGEPAPLSEDVVDAHLANCPQCTRYWENSLALSRKLGFGESRDDGMTPPDLSEIIIAGVEPQWRRTAQARALGLALARLLLVFAALGWIIWSVQLISQSGQLIPFGPDGQTLAPEADPALASALIDGAAFRLALALGLLSIAWKPTLVSGALPIVGSLWMFLVGFTVRDVVLGTLSEGQFVHLALLLFSLVAMVATWLNDRGFLLLRASWKEIKADPVEV